MIITINKAEKAKIEGTKTNSEGKYALDLHPNTTYWVKAEKPDFFMYSGQIDASEITNGAIYHDISLEEIVIRKSITLEDIYYDYNSYTINAALMNSQKYWPNFLI